MIKGEQAKKIAEIFKMDVEQTTAFVTATTSTDEQDITIPELKVFTADELTERDKNVEESIKERHYIEGKDAAIGMEVKRIRDEKKLDLGDAEDWKTLDNLMNVHKSSVLKEANKEPNQKITELESDKSTLQGTIDTLKQSHQNEIDGLNNKLTDHSLNTRIESAIPEDCLPDGVTKADARMMIRSTYQFKTVEGKLNILQDGEVRKDEKMNLLDINALMTEFIDDRGWKPGKAPGRNNDDDFGADANTIVEFKRIQSADDLDAYCRKHNLLPQSDTILTMMEKHLTKEQRDKVFRTK